MSILARLLWIDLILTVFLAVGAIAWEDVRTRKAYEKQWNEVLTQVIDGTRIPLEHAAWWFDRKMVEGLLQGISRVPGVEHVRYVDVQFGTAIDAISPQKTVKEPQSKILEKAIQEESLASPVAKGTLVKCCQELIRGRQVFWTRLHKNEGSVNDASVNDASQDKPIGTLFVEVSDRGALAQIEEHIRMIVLYSIGFGALFFVVVFFLFRQSVALPIANLARNIRGSADILTKAPVEGGGAEIVSLTEDYNRLVDRVQTQMQELHTQKMALQRMNEELRNLDTLKDQFVRMVAHELKAPITGVRGFAELLNRDINASPEDRAMMARELMKSADRITALTNQLLDVMLVESGSLRLNRSQCDFLALVNKQLAMVKEHRPTRPFETSLPQALTVFCDPYRVGQIVFQLIDNACKFSPANTVVAVKLESDGRVCVFEVEDQGVGVPEWFEERMFTPFARGHADTEYENDGAGAGLFLAKSIAQLHGGDMEYRRRSGGGSVFSLKIPVKEDDGVSV